MKLRVNPHDVLEHPGQALEHLRHGRRSAFSRFPLLFTLLGAFGGVATIYGFEHLIDKVPYLARNPIISLLVGVGILILTGSLYKRL